MNLKTTTNYGLTVTTQEKLDYYEAMTNKTAIKEKPILFSTELVQAILDGRKTQTRRVIKPQPEKQHYVDTFCEEGPGSVTATQLTEADMEIDTLLENCPYGKPGDELWVRETWRVSSHFDEVKPSEIPCGNAIAYKSGNSAQNQLGFGRWRPSIHMPRWMSRIQLKVKDIRVERVQDISEEAAIAEGVKKNCVNQNDTICPSCKPKGRCEGEGEWYHYLRDFDDFPAFSATESFKSLWDSINADRGYSWESNPWVWVVEFSIKDIKE